MFPYQGFALDRYRFLAKRLRAEIFAGDIYHDVFLTKGAPGRRHVITYSERIPVSQRLLGVGLLLGALHFAWEGCRFGLRFSPPEAGIRAASNQHKILRAYRAVRPWLAEFLMPESIKAEMAREQWTILDVCREYDLTPDIVAAACGLPPCETIWQQHERAAWAERLVGW